MSDENSHPGSLKWFFIQVALWLPLSFYFWFNWSGLFVAPVELGVQWTLAAVLGDHLKDVYQVGHMILIEIFFEPPDGTQLPLDPMIYGYGLPLLTSLVISTPNPIWVRTVQVIVGWLLICGVQAWGIVFETFHQLQTYTGPDGVELLRSAGVHAEFVAFGYQFGYLILPAVIPVAIWMLLNRRFFEGLAGSRALAGETQSADDGQLDRPE